MNLVTVCPHCGKKNDRHMDMTEEGAREPIDGDFSMCHECGAFATFDHSVEGHLRHMTREEKAHTITYRAMYRALWIKVKAEEAEDDLDINHPDNS